MKQEIQNSIKETASRLWCKPFFFLLKNAPEHEEKIYFVFAFT